MTSGSLHSSSPTGVKEDRHIDTSKPHWTLTVAMNSHNKDDFEFYHETTDEDYLVKLKKSLSPDEMVKLMEVREEFLSNCWKKNAGGKRAGSSVASGSCQSSVTTSRQSSAATSVQSSGTVAAAAAAVAAGATKEKPWIPDDPLYGAPGHTRAVFPQRDFSEFEVTTGPRRKHDRAEQERQREAREEKVRDYQRTRDKWAEYWKETLQQKDAKKFGMLKMIEKFHTSWDKELEILQPLREQYYQKIGANFESSEEEESSDKAADQQASGEAHG